jgi:colicin import membrane protein
MSENMQPEAVARTLAKVEDQWHAQALQFNECNATAASQQDAETCTDAEVAFKKSCTTVVRAVVQASGGDRAVVGEYMQDVCSQPELKGRKQQRCQLLETSIEQAMSQDTYTNRESLNTGRLCQGFWLRVAFEETSQGQSELAANARAEATAEAAKKAAEASKKATQEAIAEEKTDEKKAKEAVKSEEAEVSKTGKEVDAEVKEADDVEADAKHLIAEATDAPTNSSTPKAQK